MLHRRTNFEVRRPSRSVDSTRLPFQLETGAHYCSWHRQSTLLFLGIFVLDLWPYGPTPVRRTTWPLHHDLSRWRSWRCPWCGSSCCNCLPSFKFVGLSIRKIWRTFWLSISRLGDLDLWPLTFDLESGIRIIVRMVDNLPTNFGVSDTSFSIYGLTPCQTHHVTSRSSPLTLEVTLVGDTGLRTPCVYQVWSS